ncbi:hypothetical protein BU24DRAFT_19296 [Aaosphaeria arxii CBS 175.79]|uniref:HRDC domain-containing protein n=1 Tax=Aaosphaeria arxii CBS 175.79 TaxID=1450172 RepID=A0A6A5Y8I6_9PLEO|nr:uncharacterized protein BU24DRAFT_19296 [Aaosphaeria arxii CBS 175.79]KAF2021327.1 hypothetical protein BU24DRAFT_19296 [Aaosphaeria arxii CBS 175.79]
MFEETTSNLEDVAGNATGENQTWPRPFKLAAEPTINYKPYWDHTLYRGPNNEEVKVTYCKTKEQSENAAQAFLGEELVGFDMEWVISYKKGEIRDLQDEISMIQIASEHQIALFHIGQHVGKTTDDLIAPSLRKIIESPNIVKTGHNIMSADCGRLLQYFGITAKGIFELCHLDYLVTHGPTEPSRVNTVIRNTSLGAMVQKHLGYPMCKDDDIRKCNWRREIYAHWQPHKKRLNYAAADAYAGPMLYHCMNAQRLAMDPVPPMPLLADKYLPFKGAGRQAIRLHSDVKGEEYTTAEKVFAVAKTTIVPTEENQTNVETIDLTADGGGVQLANVEANNGESKKPKSSFESSVDQDPLNGTEMLLYDRLENCRNELAIKHNCEPYAVTSVAALKRMARTRPDSAYRLKKIRGIGGVFVNKYGADFLRVIAAFNDESPNAPDPVHTPRTVSTIQFTTPPAQSTKSPAPKLEKSPFKELDATENALFEALRSKRAHLSRMDNLPAYVVAHDLVLKNIARSQPQDTASLRMVKGIGPMKLEKYGLHWLEVIDTFLKANNPPPSVSLSKAPVNVNVPANANAASIYPPKTPNRDTHRNGGPSVARTPQLHTGLSFTFENTTLDSGTDRVGPSKSKRLVYDDDSPISDQTFLSIEKTILDSGTNRVGSSKSKRVVYDDESPTSEQEIFLTPPSRPSSASGLKRKRNISGFFGEREARRY